MRGALVVMVLVAACGGSGVDLEVTSDEAFDHVEVFIGTDDCYTTDPTTHQQIECDGVAWQPAQIRPIGEVYVMKPDERIISIDDVKGSRATMHLEASDDYRQPKVIAIVAFQGDTAVAFSTLWGVRIPASSAEHWKIELDKASPASDEIKRKPADGEPDKRVYAWTRERVEDPAALSRCLAMQFWDSSENVWKSKFIVPQSDPDCDGQTLECDPLYTDYNANALPRACVTPVDNVTGMPCAVGGSRCADGVSDTWDCTPPQGGLTCIPQAVCGACAGSDSTVACVIGAFGGYPPDPALAAFDCTFHPSDGGTTCSTEQAANTTTLQLPVACKDVEVRDATTPFSNSGSPHTATVGTASIDVAAFSSGNTCLVKLSWNQGLVDTLAPEKMFIFVVSSSTTSNTIAIPVHLQIVGPVATCTSGTTAPSACAHTPVATEDTMYNCLR